MKRTATKPGFTLVEVMISMTLGAMVMAAIISTYVYLGRNLTRLSYTRALEVQSRYILTTLANDVRSTKYARGTANNVWLYQLDGGVIGYAFSSNNLTRDRTGPVSMISDIKGETVTVPVTMSNFAFRFYTTTDGPATYQSTSVIPPISTKQIEVSFTLTAGSTTQANSGTLTTLQVVSGRMLLRNRQIPDGS